MFCLHIYLIFKKYTYNFSKNQKCRSFIDYTFFLTGFTKEIEEVGQFNYLTLLYSSHEPLFSH